jgi:hypothetical protein
MRGNCAPLRLAEPRPKTGTWKQCAPTSRSIPRHFLKFSMVSFSVFYCFTRQILPVLAERGCVADQSQQPGQFSRFPGWQPPAICIFVALAHLCYFVAWLFIFQFFYVHFIGLFQKIFVLGIKIVPLRATFFKTVAGRARRSARAA